MFKHSFHNFEEFLWIRRKIDGPQFYSIDCFRQLNVIYLPQGCKCLTMCRRAVVKLFRSSSLLSLIVSSMLEYISAIGYMQVLGAGEGTVLSASATAGFGFLTALTSLFLVWDSPVNPLRRLSNFVLRPLFSDVMCTSSSSEAEVDDGSSKIGV